MKRILHSFPRIAASTLALALTLGIAANNAVAQKSGLNSSKSEKAPMDGREIAEDLCRRAPAHSETSTGLFQYRNAKNKRSQVRASFSTTVSESGWENLY